MATTKKELKAEDWIQIEKYMIAGSKQVAIAQAYGMSPEALRYKFKEHYGDNYHNVNESFNRKGEMMIEELQFELAKTGHPTMLIYLGKVRCKQRETDDAPKEAPHQANIDLTHENMQLKNRVAELEAKINANIS